MSQNNWDWDYQPRMTAETAKLRRIERARVRRLRYKVFTIAMVISAAVVTIYMIKAEQSGAAMDQLISTALLFTFANTALYGVFTYHSINDHDD